MAETAALATNQIEIEFPGGYTAKVNPRRLADGKVMLNVDLNTPYGKVEACFFMSYETYSTCMTVAAKAKMHIKIADFFMHHFGGRPVQLRHGNK